MSENKKLTFSSLCLGLCFVLPLLTAGNTQAATMLCLMHFPVMVCGMMCGAPWGVAVGVTAPILRSLMFELPPMFPQAVSMCLEMGTYGLVCGLLANDSRKEAFHVFFDLLLAMLAGRAVWGICMAVFTVFSDMQFSLLLFQESVMDTWPGIILQLMSLPPLIVYLQTFHAPDNIQTI